VMESRLEKETSPNQEQQPPKQEGADDKLTVRITKREEMFLGSKVRKRAFQICDPVVLPYVECNKNRAVSGLWACKDEKRKMLECLRNVQERAEQEVREEYIAEKTQRLREKANQNQ
jgi:hypothetical protein